MIQLIITEGNTNMNWLKRLSPTRAVTMTHSIKSGQQFTQYLCVLRCMSFIDEYINVYLYDLIELDSCWVGPRRYPKQ